MTVPPRVFRLLFAAGCFGCGLWLLANVLGMNPTPADLDAADEGIRLAPSPALEVAFSFGGGVFLLIVGLFCAGPELAAIAAAPLHALVDAIYLPGGRASKPELNLKLPAFYVKEGRTEEALAEYRKILRYHPDTLEAWIGAIDLLTESFGEFDEARRLFDKGRRRFREQPEKLVELESHWHRVANRFEIR
ncbi:MAG: tetratricopeptide repeat protein [Verrucomicrobiae bacterium]|nr:tetratricopeptide repeat protein [Verrucomicrobiae bacterium]